MAGALVAMDDATAIPSTKDSLNGTSADVLTGATVVGAAVGTAVNGEAVEGEANEGTRLG